MSHRAVSQPHIPHSALCCAASTSDVVRSAPRATARARSMHARTGAVTLPLPTPDPAPLPLPPPTPHPPAPPRRGRRAPRRAPAATHPARRGTPLLSAQLLPLLRASEVEGRVAASASCLSLYKDSKLPQLAARSGDLASQTDQIREFSDLLETARTAPTRVVNSTRLGSVCTLHSDSKLGSTSA